MRCRAKISTRTAYDVNDSGGAYILGQKWFKRRKLLTPSFHFKILEEFLQVFNYQSKIFIDILKEDADDGRKELEICEYITRCTLDTICG